MLQFGKYCNCDTNTAPRRGQLTQPDRVKEGFSDEVAFDSIWFLNLLTAGRREAQSDNEQVWGLSCASKCSLKILHNCDKN